LLKKSRNTVATLSFLGNFLGTEKSVATKEVHSNTVFSTVRMELLSAGVFVLTI
jgi:hypothetical protein